MTGRLETAARLDKVLRRSVEAREVPGVVAMVANDLDVIYESAFGVRRLDGVELMTLDTLFRLQSMTKAVTSVAAMQLVEQGKLALDDPVPAIDEALSAPRVLIGFDTAGQPLLRPARRQITLKHLLTHTAGFSYPMWNRDVTRYADATGTPPIMSGRLAALRMPLMFDPGEKWEYGINIDWVGRLVEELSGEDLNTYCRAHICAPLGMADTGYVPTAEQQARQATGHQRLADGSLEPQSPPPPATLEFFAGGGGLYSTARDYLLFLRALLNGGCLGGSRILNSTTVALMGRNRYAPHRIEPIVSVAQPGPSQAAGAAAIGTGLAVQHIAEPPAKRRALPFADPQILALYRAFKRSVYAAIQT